MNKLRIFILSHNRPELLKRAVGLAPSTKVVGAVQPKEAFHGTEALLYPEPRFGNRFVETLLGGPQRAIASCLLHDPVALFAAQLGSVGLAGIGLFGKHTLSVRAFDHGFKLGALGLVGRGGMDLIHEAFFICASKCLVAEGELGSLLYPTGIRVGAEIHLRII